MKRKWAVRAADRVLRRAQGGPQGGAARSESQYIMIAGGNHTLIKRKRNAGDAAERGNVLRPAEILPNSRSGSAHRPSDYCPYFSSVTKIGSEVPILATASPRRKRRGAPAPVRFDSLSPPSGKNGGLFFANSAACQKIIPVSLVTSTPI